VALSKSFLNLNFGRERSWVHRNTARCIPTHPSWISVASSIELSGWVYSCVSMSLRFCDGWPEAAACLYEVLFQT
jgi:hypothetical protein